MDKILKEQFMGVISFIFMIILSLTGYAYLSDKDVSQRDIIREAIERKETDNEIKEELNRKVDKSEYNEFKDFVKDAVDRIETNNEANAKEIIEIIKNK